MLCAISIVFERIVYKQIKKTFERKLCIAQHGFRQRHSTVTQLLLYCADLYQVYLDIAKIFDMINFNILLQKLARFGFVEKFLKFFDSYLVERQQRVKIADSYSTFSKISSGSPQGSIFAVFLFSVYMNDLPDQLNNKTFLYADGTKIIGQISKREELQFDINRAIEGFGSYLVERQQRVKIADSYSTFSKISSGGPQGSIFAVFLFSVYMNDLPDQLNNRTFLYADGTKIIGQISEREELQFDINRAIEGFGSYLVEQQQRVKIADSYSTFSKISSGGPQGSIFAVFLFSVYMNDLPDQLNNKTFLYADGTKIIGQILEREELQLDINRAIEGFGSNKLNVNFDKFSILEFSYKNTYNSSIELFAKTIGNKNEKQIKDIGLFFTASMT